MKQSQFKKGIIYATAGSLWWGLLGTVFFKYISSLGALEVTIHRLIWTSFILFFSTLIFKKFNVLKKILKQKKNLLILFFTSILIFLNWGTWIYAISINKIIDASYGYFIFPILNVFLGYLQGLLCCISEFLLYLLYHLLLNEPLDDNILFE